MSNTHTRPGPSANRPAAGTRRTTVAYLRGIPTSTWQVAVRRGRDRGAGAPGIAA